MAKLSTTDIFGELKVSLNAKVTGDLTVAGTITSGGFSGNGSALTTLNASNLSSGTIPDARITGSYTGLTNLTGSGTVDFSRFLCNAADTVSAPSFSWTGDIDTGIYSPAADQLAITTGGVQRLLINSAGVTAATFTGALSGNATTATTLQNAITIGTMTGDVTSNGSSFNGSANNSNVATIGANKVTNAKAAQMATMTIKGNNTDATANQKDLTVAEADILLQITKKSIKYALVFG